MKILQRIVSSVVLLSFISTQAGAVTLQRLPTFYASTDALGSTTLVTQDNGAVVEKRSYDAFGKRRNPSWSAVDVYGQIAGAQLDQGYTSHVEDFESDTVHMRGRTYDPKLARFTSADPVIDGVNATQRWNRYAYVSNNPLRYIDPTGFTYEIVERPSDQGGTGTASNGETPATPGSQAGHGSPPPPPTPATGPTQDEPKGGGSTTSPPGQIGGSAGAGGACAGCRGNGVADSEYGGGGSYGNHNQSARAERERNAREAQQLQKNMKSDAARQRHAKEQLDGRGGTSPQAGLGPGPLNANPGNMIAIGPTGLAVVVGGAIIITIAGSVAAYKQYEVLKKQFAAEKAAKLKALDEETNRVAHEAVELMEQEAKARKNGDKALERELREQGRWKRDIVRQLLEETAEVKRRRSMFD